MSTSSVELRDCDEVFRLEAEMELMEEVIEVDEVDLKLDGSSNRSSLPLAALRLGLVSGTPCPLCGLYAGRCGGDDALLDGLESGTRTFGLDEEVGWEGAK